MLQFKTGHEEQNFVEIALKEMDHWRKLLGWENDAKFREGSLLYKWQMWQDFSEQDFSARATEDSIFGESNLSRNMPLTQVTQKEDKMGNDLLGSHKFFGAETEGAEDQHPGVKVLERVLHARSETLKLNEVFKEAIGGPLRRGQEVGRAMYSEDAYMEPVTVRDVRLGTKIIRHPATGVPVLSNEVWTADPTDPNLQMLENDPAVKVPRGTAFRYGKPKVMMERRTEAPGCDMKIIYFGDFFWCINSPSIAESKIKGHTFRQNVSDLLLSYQADMMTDAGKQYFEDHKAGRLSASSELDYQVMAPLPKVNKGEDDDQYESSASLADGSYNRRTYAEIWIRHDADGDGHAETIYLLVDLQDRRAVHYEYAQLVLPWMKRRFPHPYFHTRIKPKKARATGTGYYEELAHWMEFSDRMLNRIEIDAQTSGNVAFENLDATFEGLDGQSIQYRTRQPYTLRPTYEADQALKVITVNPSNIPIFSELMDQMDQRQLVQAGMTSPTDVEQSGLQGSKTLGAMQMMENTGNQELLAREAEILAGLTDGLHSFADIEVYSIKRNPRAYAELVGDEDMRVLLEYLNNMPGDHRKVFRIALTKAHSSQIVQTAEAVKATLAEFRALPTPYKLIAAHVAPYSRILRGLGEPNPELALDVEACVKADMMIAAANMEAEKAANDQKSQPGKKA